MREICNSAYGNTWRTANIDDIIKAGRKKIFNFDYDLFDNGYKAVLETKIIRHYFMYEIGQETLNLWLFDFKSKWLEIIPFYNKYYLADLLKYDPLKNTDTTDQTETITDTWGDDDVSTQTKNSVDVDSHVEVDDNTIHVKNTDQTTNYLDKNTTTTYNTTDNESGSVNTIQYTGEQDTPQGRLSDIKSLNYLSKAGYLDSTVTPVNHQTQKTGTDIVKEGGSVKVSNSGNDTDNTQSTTDTKSNTKTVDDSKSKKVSHTNTKTDSTSVGTVDTRTNDTSNSIDNTHGDTVTAGKTGTETYSEMLQKYRDTFINIDMMIIDDLREMFMMVW